MSVYRKEPLPTSHLSLFTSPFSLSLKPVPPSWTGPRWWRRLPLAIQLASITVSVTVGWALLSRALAQRRDARAAATLATTAVVGRLATQVAELGSATLAMQSAQRGYLLTRDDRTWAPYAAAERRLTALRDSVAFEVTAFADAQAAFVA